MNVNGMLASYNRYWHYTRWNDDGTVTPIIVNKPSFGRIITVHKTDCFIFDLNLRLYVNAAKKDILFSNSESVMWHHGPSLKIVDYSKLFESMLWHHLTYIGI